jgi:hypothetical protein
MSAAKKGVISKIGLNIILHVMFKKLTSGD